MKKGNKVGLAKGVSWYGGEYYYRKGTVVELCQDVPDDEGLNFMVKTKEGHKFFVYRDEIDFTAESGKE